MVQIAKILHPVKKCKSLKMNGIQKIKRNPVMTANAIPARSSSGFCNAINSFIKANRSCKRASK